MTMVFSSCSHRHECNPAMHIEMSTRRITSPSDRHTTEVSGSYNLSLRVRVRRHFFRVLMNSLAGHTQFLSDMRVSELAYTHR